MAAAGLHSWIDPVGNVHGRTQGSPATAPALLVGSHYDTVIDGGKYDGALGIISGICAVKALLVQVRGAQLQLGSPGLDWLTSSCLTGSALNVPLST